ncbi:hypothetical protein CCL21_11725 [Pseudomonas syringae]|uniref:hypothetical protein n=1 Tax=Pseudomonas syringae TaxID=317 RepID=UPI000BB5ED73|nr:hypothetical protein [Pseudomonas syringae]PBP70028.1 hypothetical protein CCL21_11725 [Pseudomonas syringae]
MDHSVSAITARQHFELDAELYAAPDNLNIDYSEQLKMSIEANIALVRVLIDQIPHNLAIEMEDFSDETAKGDVLFGLREMHTLGLIDGNFVDDEISDPTGPLLKTVSLIRLTKLGRSFK